MEDPRKLERWWGPPTYPATFTRHDFVVGGESRYFMTGPAGETSRGWWRIEAIDKPRRLDFANGLAGDDGEPALASIDGRLCDLRSDDNGTRMTAVTRFIDASQMQTMLDMACKKGWRWRSDRSTLSLHQPLFPPVNAQFLHSGSVRELGHTSHSRDILRSVSRDKRSGRGITCRSKQGSCGTTAWSNPADVQ